MCKNHGGVFGLYAKAQAALVQILKMFGLLFLLATTSHNLPFKYIIEQIYNENMSLLHHTVLMKAATFSICITLVPGGPVNS